MEELGEAKGATKELTVLQPPQHRSHKMDKLGTRTTLMPAALLHDAGT